MAESVDAPDLKSVDHCGRGSSSLPTRIIFYSIMTLHTINYCHHHASLKSLEDSPFVLDEVSFDIESEFSSIGKSVYSKCPVWKHKYNRTFVVRSPIDIEFSVDTKTQSINSRTLSSNELQNLIVFHGDWCTEEKVTLQFCVPKVLFWTKSKNIWIEQCCHPNTTADNNFKLVEGWFNLSNWTRQVSFGFDIHNLTKPVIIKRGDPLYRVRFYSTNLDDGYKLKRSEPPKDIVVAARRRTNVTSVFTKNNIPENIKNNLFKNKPSKCPFNFLFKK